MFFLFLLGGDPYLETHPYAADHRSAQAALLQWHDQRRERIGGRLVPIRLEGRMLGASSGGVDILLGAFLQRAGATTFFPQIAESFRGSNF